MKKEKKVVIKHIHIRAPESYYYELQKIAENSGLSINSLCLELLRDGIKVRLKEMKLNHL
jgi:predicted DNA-binding ribbon-helix-helix protein